MPKRGLSEPGHKEREGGRKQPTNVGNKIRTRRLRGGTREKTR